MRHSRIVLATLAAAAVISLAGGARAQMAGKMVNPNVLLVIDSSGSMDWIAGHPESAGESWSQAQDLCEQANVLGSADVARTSWQQLLDVMLGEIPSDQYHCFVETPEMRPALQAGTIASEDVTTYISEYLEVPHNHFRAISCDDADWNAAYGQCVGPSPDTGTDYQMMEDGVHICKLYVDLNGDGVDDPEEQNYFSATSTSPELCFDYHDKAKVRKTNGILERYRTLARFGIMTYDNRPGPAPLPPDPPLADEHEGLWNYGTSRAWDCKQWFYGESVEGNKCIWNAGARANNPNAVGRLVPISDDLDGSNAQVREVLDTTEPLYCSPTGALLDDVGYYFSEDPFLKPADGSSGADLYFACRPKIVILISDGQPTADFEFPREYCTTSTTSHDIDIVGTDAEGRDVYKCPWNSSHVEVQQLVDLVDYDTTGDDPILLVVIGLNAGGKWEATPADPTTYTGVDCKGTHTWEPVDVDFDGTPDIYECVPPDSRCVQVGIPQTETMCLAGEYYNDVSASNEDAFLTPRQFLNELALDGWSLEMDDYLTAPWRGELSDWCSDSAGDPNFGNCGGETYDGKENGAIFVESAEELSAVLDLILSQVTATSATRTEVVTTNQVEESLTSGLISNATSGVAQYEFTSGFEVIGGKPWRGYLYREGYSCVQDDTGGEAVDDTLVSFHDFLKTQAETDSRRIFTVDDNALGNLDYATASSLIKGSDVMVELEAGSTGLDDCDVGGPTDNSVCASKTDILDQVSAHMYGKAPSMRAEHPLADIYNSSPAILAPPLETAQVSSYQQYKTLEYTPEGTATPIKYMERPPYLYVGSSDGALHSFNTWGTDGDVEEWGFVPHTLLGGLRLQFPIEWTLDSDPITGDTTGYTVPAMSDQLGLYQHIFGVDGSPVARDLLLYKDPDDAANEADRWRSVVIGGLGKGGVGYYAIDVTDPSARPRLRWEISEDTDTMGHAGNNSAGTFTGTSSFGFGIPLARPAVAYLYMNSPIPGDATNALHEEAVAILPGGYKNTETEGPEASTGAYIVSVTDGRLIRELMPNDDDDICGGAVGSGMVAQLVGEPVVPEGTRSSTVADEAFMGDDRGRLWRLDFSSTDPGDWCLEMYFDTLIKDHFQYQDCIENACCSGSHSPVTDPCDDTMITFHATDDEWGIDACTGGACPDVDYPFPRTPIINPPTIVQDRDRNNVIIFGTGQLDGVEILDHHRVFSLTERVTFTVGDSANASYTEREDPEINWWLGEPITSEMVSATPSEYTAQLGHMQDTHIGFPVTSTQGDMWNLGEKMLGTPVVFEEVAYFTSYIPVNLETTYDACESGGSRIWGVNFDASLDGPNSAYASVEEFGQLRWDSDADGLFDMEAPFKDIFDDEGNGVLLTGLNIVRRPACSGEATFELVTQRATSTSEKAATPSGESPKQFTTEKLEIRSRNAGFTTVLIDSWSLVFE